jgi:hypothetical protein
MTKKYVIDFYDAFDGWGDRQLGEIIPGYDFDSLTEAKKRCDELMIKLDANNKNMGEHFSVFDGNREIYRGQK